MFIKFKMWSLYSNYPTESRYLEPLSFSNGKTQQDIVEEVIKTINEGYKIIFIKGVCGTGKSAIALNLSKDTGKASIVVPVKNLQKQYEEDYTHRKYLLKENGERLKISVVTGRANHLCPYLKELDEGEIEEVAKRVMSEKNSSLDIFDSPPIQMQKKESKNDYSCDNSQIPCKIEIKEKNFKKIKEYLKKNEKVKSSFVFNLNHIRRMSIAPVCPYWSPIAPSEIELNLGDAEKRNYRGLMDKTYTIYQRKHGCGYYEQFKEYLDSDVLIFNSQKYKIETLMNRKPFTDIEIIDECDEFLDSFSNSKSINLTRLSFALGTLFPDEKTQEIVEKISSLTQTLLRDKKIIGSISNDKIVRLEETEILLLLKLFLDSDLMNLVECDEENYCYQVDETARTFQGFFEETYVSFYKEEKDLFVRLVTTNLEKRFKELIDKNKVVVMMSGTIHSEGVLKDIFGLKDFKIIEAETKMPGKLTALRTGKEINCRYSNFQQGKVTREQYLKALEKCIEIAKRPVLIHVNSFKDLPTEREIGLYSLGEVMSQEKLRAIQSEEGVGESVRRFKQKERDILYSTKCNRGVDFPGETCNSIILTKYPYPNVQGVFWRILKKTKPQYYNEFYIDKAKREFLQRVYRGLRSEDDKVFLLSPDIRVFSGVF